MNYYTLNNKYSTLSYTLLFYITILFFYNTSNYLIWRIIPTKKDIIQTSIMLCSIVIFNLFIGHGIVVKVYDDKHNNDHISKLY